MRDTARVASRIVLGAAAATVLASILAGRLETFTPGYFDEDVYRRLARNLLDHGYYGYAPGENVAWRAPGYPFFLVGMRWIVDAQWFVRAVQAVLAGVTVLLAAGIARRLFGPVAAAGTAVLLFITGITAAYASFELSETLATLLLVTAAWLALRAADARSLRDAALSGCALGLSALTRPQGIVIVGFVALWLVLALPASRRWAGAAVLIAAALATIAPWTIRNAIRLDAIVPISTYGGINLWLSNNPEANGRFPGSAAMMIDAAEFARITALPEVEEDREWFRLAFAYIRQHPLTAIRNWVRDGAIYVGARDTSARDRLVFRDAWTPPILDDRLLWPLAFGGGLLAVRRRELRVLLPAFVIASFVGFFMVFLPVSRYRHGAHPFLAMYAGAAVARLISAAVTRRGLTPPAESPTGSKASGPVPEDR